MIRGPLLLERCSLVQCFTISPSLKTAKKARKSEGSKHNPRSLSPDWLFLGCFFFDEGMCYRMKPSGSGP